MAPLVAMMSGALLFEYEPQLQPNWLCAEGFVKIGSADAHILVAQLVTEKAFEGGGGRAHVVFEGSPFGRCWVHNAP